jgi:two-component system chemotaxis response regulator CheB
VVNGRRLHTIRGPRENGVRPAIDPLFRSLAAHHGPRAVGIVLTGLRDDGTAGLQAIRRSGGVTVVQDPDDAEHPEMPRSVLSHVAVDYVVPIARMGELMESLTRPKAPEGVEPPPDVVREARITARYGTDEKAVSELGSLSMFDCPECGGALWEMRDEGVPRFRCYVGHAYSQPALAAVQAERSLLVALRTLEERARMLHRLSEQGRAHSDSGQEDHFARERDETVAHAEVLRELLAAVR